jgi:hypothetical protein
LCNAALQLKRLLRIIHSDYAIRLNRIGHGNLTSMIRHIALIFLAFLASSGSLRAAEDGTPAQRRACRPDVFKLCSEWIPKHDAITYCLHKNIDRLSPACRAVMEGKLR